MYKRTLKIRCTVYELEIKKLEKYITGDNKASHTDNKHENSEKNVQLC